jgi:hypothetical protein
MLLLYLGGIQKEHTHARQAAEKRTKVDMRVWGFYEIWTSNQKDDFLKEILH